MLKQYDIPKLMNLPFVGIRKDSNLHNRQEDATRQQYQISIADYTKQRVIYRTLNWYLVTIKKTSKKKGHPKPMQSNFLSATDYRWYNQPFLL